MDLNKLIEEITQEVLAKLSTKTVGVTEDGLTPASMAEYIDHTLLKPDASEEQIRKVCDEARKNHFASVCVNPSYIKLVASQLEGSGVAPCVVVGFPLGATPPEVKANETDTVIFHGAKEVDLVINIGAVKSGDWALVKRDIEAVVRMAKGRALVKVIIEACLLTDEEKVKACALSKDAGADFVKTSTGFSTGGATVEDVRLMRQTVGPVMGVKASGGVRDYATAVAMVKAGAMRLGTSSGAKIVAGSTEKIDCINCGRCLATCPTDNVTINKNDY